MPQSLVANSIHFMITIKSKPVSFSQDFLSVGACDKVWCNLHEHRESDLAKVIINIEDNALANISGRSERERAMSAFRRRLRSQKKGKLLL